MRAVLGLLLCVAIAGSALVLRGCSSAEPHRPVTTAASEPIVIELFTSEGCSSCPPADVVLLQGARSRRILGAAATPLRS